MQRTEEEVKEICATKSFSIKIKNIIKLDDLVKRAKEQGDKSSCASKIINKLIERV